MLTNFVEDVKQCLKFDDKKPLSNKSAIVIRNSILNVFVWSAH